MLAIIFALITYFTWGYGDIPATFASRKMGSFRPSFWIYTVGILVPSLFIPFYLMELRNLNLASIPLNMILGVLLAVCYIVFNEALRIGNASIVGTIAGSFSAVTVVLSLIFLKENILLNQALAILAILIGIVLSSFSFKEINKKSLLSRGNLLAIGTMIGWGIYYTFIKIPIKENGWFWTLYIASLVGIIVLGLYGLKKSLQFKITDKTSFRNILLSSITLTIGEFTFIYALSIGATSIVAPIAGSYTTLFVFLSRFAFKDKLTRQQWLGIIVTLAGIVLLAIFS